MAEKQVETLKSRIISNAESTQSYLKRKTSQLDQEVYRPTSRAYKDVFAAHPIALTFLSLLATTSAVPLLIFAGFAATTLAVLLALSGAFIAFWSFIVIGSAALVLGFALSITLLVSLIGTVSLLGAFLTYRFYHHITTSPNPTEGIQSFKRELADRSQASADASKELRQKRKQLKQELQASRDKLGDVAGEVKEDAAEHVNSSAASISGESTLADSDSPKAE
ncbi:uncharacterized protein L969DRAFT_20925 [Mixia osmundae IAM 14324]|uniref:Uncharacterized protein n=1 Tax=Mixia osmundae (strain CBS 9802 / IAM 14324 / JCM 22182 / KY 12970) TaxID=764103 RepID=G7E409_MIXOS|nr:uncharacterized protein L969DRAFT_20925 [Mixia osmundae IAM 14324]KEI42015.1 hypothetical protein L969DRAFT_20925 [Mixia osmundae IAM 14324]GAA97569.1 hypothetical protein E5Q_04247 [Mixia osmundae IAM 14324]